MRSKPNTLLLFVVVFLSGAAGLIYQVTWHKYLAILLGAQAKATAIVLAIFLGGISAGYLCFGYWSRTRRWNLLAAYSVIEVLLAFWGLFFASLFGLFQNVTTAYYAKFGVESLGIDLLVSLGLLGIPTFLMGGTLPLLTQGLAEDVKTASRTHARIYGWNTVGACFGAVLAGYLLIPNLDLPVTLTIAALFNALAGGVTYFGYARGLPAVKKTATKAKRALPPMNLRVVSIFAVGFLSGLYVLTLENVFMRLIGLSTGSSNYTFTLVVSIFVLSLGMGSLLVRRIGDFSEKHLVWNQLGVAASLLMLYFTVDFWPYWVHLVRIIFRDTPTNFFIYQSALAMGFLVLFLVPIGFCGFTLPLCFHLLKDKQETLGERVGQLYGLNTLGCVLGASIGGYWILHWINLDHLFRICVLLALSGAFIALYSGWKLKTFTRGGASIALSLGLLVLLGTVLAKDTDKGIYMQAFRQQAPMPVSFEGRAKFSAEIARAGEYLFYKDGPNTSVGVTRNVDKDGNEYARSLIVNGKSDGSTRGDGLTMTMTGAVPALLASKITRACVIGFGTGVTVGQLAGMKETESVDVVEISGTVLEQAFRFDKYNGNVSQNPKVKLHEMDAFRFLAAPEKYDVIVSEPSNPWVAGVENLYTEEFYDVVRGRLNTDGLFVQWVQLYSFNDPLLQMVLTTLSSKFPHVRVFKMQDFDVALVASDKPITGADMKTSLARWNNNASLTEALSAFGINSLDTFLAYEIATPSMVRSLSSGGVPMSLEMPRLSYAAAKANFARASADMIRLRSGISGYALMLKEGLLRQYWDGKTPSVATLDSMRNAFCDGRGKSNRLCTEVVFLEKFLYPQLPLEARDPGNLTPGAVQALAYLQKPKGKTVLTRPQLNQVHDAAKLWKDFVSPIAMLSIDGVIERLESCHNGFTKVAGECLIEEIALLNLAEPSSERWMNAVMRYQKWFGQLPKADPEYGVFAEVDRALKAKAAVRALSSETKTN